MRGKSIIIVILTLVLLPGVLSAKIDDTLVLYLSFDEGSGKEAKDSSNYGNTGQLIGDPKWVDGKFGKAVWLDGVDDFVSVPDAASLRVTEGVTVMAWINAERIEFPGAGYQGVIAKGNTYRSYSLYTHAATGGLHFSTSAKVASTFHGSTTAGKTITLKTWTHVAAIAETSKTGGKHRYYINGEPAGETVLAGLTTLPGDLDTAVTVVGKTQEGSRFFQGAIDEARIWNRALSADEVKSQMNKGVKDLIIAVQPQKKLTTTWGNIKY